MSTRKPTDSLGFLVLILGILGLLLGCTRTKSPPSVPFREPLVPTVPVTVTYQALIPVPTITPAPRPEDVRRRLGVGIALGSLNAYPFQVLNFGWYLNWKAQSAPPPRIEYVRMVRVYRGKLRLKDKDLVRVAHAAPGSLWLIGNEPDVAWQDNSTPKEYARAYAHAYHVLKKADPSARIAIGGISQVTPLRLRYLDAVLEAYKKMFGTSLPVDTWNVHTFILREERNSWGVGIPPGFEDERRGMLWDIDDHDNLHILKSQILAIRRWLYNRGYGGIPLIVSEYGILMPEVYGFPPKRVITFMHKSFDLFLTLQDPIMGDPQDGNRLVQRWCWYSLADTKYPTGNLFDPESKRLTQIGAAFATYEYLPEDH